MHIEFSYGPSQRYRRRADLLTIRGNVDGASHPLRSSIFRLNGGDPRPLYVEAEPDNGVDWTAGYKATPAELRCRHQGEFSVEFDCDDAALTVGANRAVVEVVDGAGETATAEVAFHWDPEPAPFPIDLRDLSSVAHIQDIGQAVNGDFDLDRDRNVIRSRGPVAPDALFLVGSPGGSQEATYRVRFLEPAGAKWLGCGDFHAGLTEGVPPRGIRVGWSSAGMAAMSPVDGARAFIAWGDHSGDPGEWAIATHPARPFPVQRNTRYRVRQRLSIHGGENRIRWKIWDERHPEPAGWLCDEDTGKLPAHLPRNTRATFGLFQHFGQPIEWSDILIREVTDDPDSLPGRNPDASREPFLQRNRPGAF